MAYETLVVETRGSAAIIRFNRPEVMNALNDQVGRELAQALAMVDEEDDLAAAILTGNEKVFATAMEFNLGCSEANALHPCKMSIMKSDWNAIVQCRKPVIAAVSGYVVAEGLELALMCDIILATEGTKFGMPNLSFASLPTLGGCQRLTRAVGKAKAMEMILTGRMMGVEEAESSGMVSRIVSDHDSLLDEAMRIADRLGSLSYPAISLAKEAVDAAFGSSLADGLHLEQALLQSVLSLEDWKEGIAAKEEKRSPSYHNR